MTGERKARNELWRERPDLLAEMLQLRFTEGWSYRKLAEHYKMDHVGVRIRCVKHAYIHGLEQPRVPHGRPNGRPKIRGGTFADPLVLREMLDLRFNQGWTLLACGVKYGVTREAIRQRCKKHEHEYPNHVAIQSYRPNGGHKLTTLASLLAERGETVSVELAQLTFSAPPTKKPRFPIFEKQEFRDEFGERINQGRSYKDYLKEQYPKLSMAKLKRRISGKDA